MNSRLWWWLGALLAAAGVSLALACNGDNGPERTVAITFSTPTATPIPSPVPTPTSTTTPTATPSPDVCGVNPDPAPPSVLQVEQPEPGERVGNPLHVRGWGSGIGLDDTGVAVVLIDANGVPLPLVEVPPQPRVGRAAPSGLTITEFTAPFAADLLISNLGNGVPYCIWVFVSTKEDGTPQQVVQVPVIVTP